MVSAVDMVNGHIVVVVPASAFAPVPVVPALHNTVWRARLLQLAVDEPA